MSLKLSELFKDTKTIDVEINDTDKIKLTYKTDFYTAKVESLFATSEDRPMNAMVDILTSAIIDWDVVDDKNKPIKPTREVLSELSGKIINKIMTAMIQDSLPNQKTGIE